jgi:hypothetical protein
MSSRTSKSKHAVGRRGEGRERERETGGHAGRQIDRFGKVRFIFVSLSKVYSRPYLT